MGTIKRYCHQHKMLTLILVLACASTAFARPGQFIVNGENANVGAWPWQDSLQFTSGSHTCGCSLVSQRYAVTAAHCVGSSTGSYRVQFGLHDRSNPSLGRPETYYLRSISRHPNYQADGSRGFPNDIAVIQFSSSVNTANNYISTVRLAPNDGVDYAGYTCYITGWGRTVGGGALPNILQQARIDVLTNSQCIGYVGSSLINNGHVCIRGDGVRGACNGDSGGPLSCYRGGQWYLVGAASWVIGSCNTFYPSAYARVSYFNSWITGITGPL